MTGYSFEFNNTDLGQYGLVVTGLPRKGLPVPRVQHIPLVGRDGGITIGSNFEAMPLTVTCRITSTDTHTAAENIAHVASVLAASATGEKTLVFDHDEARVYRARLNGALQSAEDMEEFDLEFLVNPPYSVAESVTTSGPHNLAGTTTKTIANPGSATVDEVTWLFKSTANGNEIVLTNTTRSETLNLTGGILTINNGNWVRVIGGSQWRYERSTDSGATWERVMSYSTGFPPSLSAGNNSVTVTGFTGTLTVTFYARYF